MRRSGACLPTRSALAARRGGRDGSRIPNRGDDGCVRVHGRDAGPAVDRCQLLRGQRKDPANLLQLGLGLGLGLGRQRAERCQVRIASGATVRQRVVGHKERLVFLVEPEPSAAEPERLAGRLPLVSGAKPRRPGLLTYAIPPALPGDSWWRPTADALTRTL
jgi:hypothetical protein